MKTINELLQENTQQRRELEDLQKLIEEYRNELPSRKFYIWCIDSNYILTAYQYNLLENLDI